MIAMTDEGGCFKNEKAREKVWKMFWVPLVLLPTSLHVHLSFFFFLPVLLLLHLPLPFLCGSQMQTRSPPSFLTSHPPLAPTHVLTLPFLSLPRLYTSCLISAFTHKPSADSYSRGKYFVRQRRRLTIPYVVFALRCASVFFFFL